MSDERISVNVGRRWASVDGRAKHRLISRMLFVSLVACAGVVVGAPIAMADACPPLDLGCTIDSTTTPVIEAAEDTTTTVGEVLDDTTTTVGEVLDDTTTTVGEVLEDTATTVGDVVDEGVGPITGGVPPVVPDAPDVLPGPGDQPSGGGSEPPGDQPAPPGGGSPGGGGGTQVGPATGTNQGARVPIVGPDSGTGISFDRLGGIAGFVGRSHVRFVDDGSALSRFVGTSLAGTLAFPLLLILLVIGFVLVQNTIDRKDPKLALAPVGADHLPFS
jgi:hypothetical protein